MKDPHTSQPLQEKHKVVTPIPEPDKLKLPPAGAYALLLAVIVFFGITRVRLLSLPLERDEGEYAYSAQLILHGVAPYQFCYTMKFPGTAAAYALIISVFGETPRAVHLGLLLINSASIILMYLLAQRLFGGFAGPVASAAFALLSISPQVEGFAAHATQFVVPFAVAGILILLTAFESRRLLHFFASGALLGLAVLMKQPGFFFLLFAVLYLLRSQRKARLPLQASASQLAALLGGATLPVLLTCLLLLRAGVFGRFWFWTFSYAREYGTYVPLSDGLQFLWSSGSLVVAEAYLIWLIAALGILTVLWDPKTAATLPFALGFFAASFAATCLGLHFRGHYFVLLLPAVSLLCAGGVCAGANLLAAANVTRKYARLPALFFLLALAFSFTRQRNFLFVMDPIKACRKFYRANPFAEALRISDFIRNHSAADERIAVIGSEPEIYFYSDRLSATGYVYMYPLMEPQPFASTMQKEMIAEIESSRPRFLVIVDTPLSWLARPDSDRTILDWSRTYVQTGYHLVGTVDMQEAGTEYRWAEAANYQTRSPYRVFLFDRSAVGLRAP